MAEKESFGATVPTTKRRPFIFAEVSPGWYRRNPKDTLRDDFPKTKQFTTLFQEYQREVKKRAFHLHTIQDCFERAIFRSLGIDLILADLVRDEGRKMLVGEDVLQFFRSTYPLSRLVKRPFDYTYFVETALPDTLIFMDVGAADKPQHVIENEVYISSESLQRGTSNPTFGKRIHRSFDRRRDMSKLSEWYHPQSQILLVTPRGSVLSEMEQQFADVRTFAPMPITMSGWHEFVQGLRSGEILHKMRRKGDAAKTS